LAVGSLTTNSGVACAAGNLVEKAPRCRRNPWETKYVAPCRKSNTLAVVDRRVRDEG
jgi:hypothetical protein